MLNQSRSDQKDSLGGEVKSPCIVAIGPETAKACRKAGLEVALTAGEHTGSGMVSAVLEKEAEHRRESHHGDTTVKH
jgi:uroporphyrinogen-III synthase